MSDRRLRRFSSFFLTSYSCFFYLTPSYLLTFLPSRLFTFSPAQAMAGKLSSQKGLIVEVDVKGYLAANKDLADCALYVVTSNTKQVFNSVLIL